MPPPPHHGSRRAFFGSAGAALTALSFTGGCANQHDADRPTPSPHLDTAATATAVPAPQTGSEALARLKAGNDRFVTGRSVNQRRDTVRAAAVAERQTPFAVVVGCADSRVPPEIIFDEGIGDLFVVRAAGNTAADPILLGSLQYGIAVLKANLVVILGHQDCGAVKAALQLYDGGNPPPGDIPAVLQPIIPTIRTIPHGSPNTRLEASVRANVKAQTAVVKKSLAALGPTDGHNTALVIGAEYELETGDIRWIPTSS